MASEYYYLVSTLPYLRFPGEMPITREDFLARCQAHLSEELYLAIAGIDRVPRANPCCEAESRWNDWETCVRNAFVRFRAVRRGVQPDDYFRPDPDAFADLEKQVLEVFDGNKNPAEERRALDRLRWQKLTDIEVGHQFDFEFLVIYHLKLVLLEKWANLSPEQGAAELQRVVEEKIPQLDVLEYSHA